jgi:hypothetical protein
MPDVVKMSWSGGKDSTCAVLKHLELGHIVKAVCYMPMFTNDIPLITKEHYEFIMKTADRFRDMGAEVHIVTGKTYYDFVLTRSSRGKFKGRMFGFPYFSPRLCGFKRDGKMKSLDKYDVGEYDYADIGIAFDETARQKQLNDRKRSILCELEMTEEDAKQYVLKYDMLSPHYITQKRDGCALCPNARTTERKQWFKDYPEAIPLVIFLQNEVKRERPELEPLRNHKFFIDDDGTIN